jgi:hypothetical protein
MYPSVRNAMADRLLAFGEISTRVAFQPRMPCSTVRGLLVYLGERVGPLLLNVDQFANVARNPDNKFTAINRRHEPSLQQQLTIGRRPAPAVLTPVVHDAGCMSGSRMRAIWHRVAASVERARFWKAIKRGPARIGTLLVECRRDAKPRLGTWVGTQLAHLVAKWQPDHWCLGHVPHDGPRSSKHQDRLLSPKHATPTVVRSLRPPQSHNF